MQNNPNITLTLKRPNKYLTFLLPLKVKARFNNDLATIFNTLYKNVILLVLLKGGIKARAKQETLKDLTKLSYFKIY